MRIPSVAPRRRGRMDEAPVYETGGMQVRLLPSTPLVVAQRSRAPPSEGGGRTFESCRRGQLEIWKRPGWMRSLSRKQVGVAPLGVRVAPLPPRFPAAMVERSRRRALNPEAGVRFPVAVLSCNNNHRTQETCQVVERQDVRLLPGRRGFEPLPGSTARWPRIEARGCKPRHGGESPSRASIAHRNEHSTVVVVQRRGSRCATPVMRVRIPPTTPLAHWPARS